MKYRLTCSKDAIDVDYEVEFERKEEPSLWECYSIAEEHGCEWWSLDRLENGKEVQVF